MFQKVIFIFMFAVHTLLFSNTQQISTRTNEEQEIIEHVQNSISNAEEFNSKLTLGVLCIEGMSSPKVRHFLNNLCSKPETHYLEIGCWKGSTFIASLFRNNDSISSAIAIDNWAEFNGPSKEFHQNCTDFLNSSRWSFLEADCFTINPKKYCNQPINIYFYDGAHTALDQEMAFTYYNDIFDDLFIAVVDDWNHPPVQEGTRSAFHKLNYEVLFERILPSQYNGDTTNWWNGLYVAVIRKPT